MTMKRALTLILVFELICISGVVGVKYSNIVLIGATGDLAKKYLWQGFFNLFLEKSDENNVFHFYGATRAEKEKGDPQLQKILEERVTCKDVDRKDCQEMKSKFMQATEYFQLKTADHYAELAMTMEKSMAEKGSEEVGTLFYLSVPPFTYATIVASIATECRPVGDAWLRVVLEKPFGKDITSAEELSKDIEAYLKEEEVYRIDHYLGKIGVKHIMPFRFQNQQTYEKLWNKDHIERVEIVMKENMDVKGRIGFYDEYGVIRDVMQNHLTEILALVAMEIPDNISDVTEHHVRKLHLMKQILPLSPESCVLGQYQEYNDQIRAELDKADDFESVTPTYATVAMEINNPRWKGVPFILMAGKMLDEKSSYVRIIFKQNIMCITKSENTPGFCHPRQIVFSTSTSDSKTPVLLVSKTLPEPNLSSDLKLFNTDSNKEVFGLPASHYFAYTSDSNPSAYSNLITSVYAGQKDKFIGTEDLLISWKIWTPLLQGVQGRKPRLYPGDKANGDWLDVVTLGNKVKYVNDDVSLVGSDPLHQSEYIRSIPADFRYRPLVSGSTDIILRQLTRDMEALAIAYVEQEGSFHMALSGGTTPNLLFCSLVLNAAQFPWENTHIWQVDERCVDSKSHLLNFKSLQENLLQYVPISQGNIHSMPVELTNSPYQEGKDLGSAMYETEIKNLIPHESLDFVLLGVGEDGHTASLFPGQPDTESDEALVRLADNGPQNLAPRRLTMTLNLINKAKNAAVLVCGQKKREIVSLLQNVGKDATKWPITGVELVDGELAWYIDHDAFL
ncbi:GDH/6PGL endoplasmic bifunctional protein-like [Ptychodera flava]|uniref:GDH/6PGL endoplasmic bifunctional protein-like n=1 Tax=Ptychodera flava TaxID=63121 RepID=UPI003969BE7D